jgi:hypothetical protein
MRAGVHLPQPLGVKGFAYRRVKNDAADLAGLLRMGRLPEAYLAPPALSGWQPPAAEWTPARDRTPDGLVVLPRLNRPGESGHLFF